MVKFSPAVKPGATNLVARKLYGAWDGNRTRMPAMNEAADFKSVAHYVYGPLTRMDARLLDAHTVRKKPVFEGFGQKIPSIKFLNSTKMYCKRCPTLSRARAWRNPASL